MSGNDVIYRVTGDFPVIKSMDAYTYYFVIIY